MSDFLCKNCRQPMRAKWDEQLGYLPEHYDTVPCDKPEFDEDDAEVLENDYLTG